MRKSLFVVGVVAALMGTSLISGAKSSGVEGSIEGACHYVPILKDYMDGYTGVANNDDFETEKIWAKTKVTVYDKKGNKESKTNTYTGKTGFKALENWCSVHVTI